MYKKLESLGKFRSVFPIVLLAFAVRVVVIPFLLGDFTNPARGIIGISAGKREELRGLSQAARASVHRRHAASRCRGLALVPSQLQHLPALHSFSRYFLDDLLGRQYGGYV
jgi:hypothetical protein